MSLHRLGQDEPDGRGVGVPHERRPSVLQGEGGDAVGEVLDERVTKMAALHTVATNASTGIL